jgi:hypothetical protein
MATASNNAAGDVKLATEASKLANGVEPNQSSAAIPTSTGVPSQSADIGSGQAERKTTRTKTMDSSDPKAAYKRIIVCCDGTWQDGIESKYR